MYICYSPSRTSIEPLNASFVDKLEDSDFGGDLKVRSNGSRRLAQAVPNPYSNSELLLYVLEFATTVQSNLDYPNPFGQGEISNRSDKQGVRIMLTTPKPHPRNRSCM